MNKKDQVRKEERFDRVKNQLKNDVLNYGLRHYGKDERAKRWNEIDHLKPIYILEHFPELKARLSTDRIKELQEISDERTKQDIATIKD